MKDKIAELLIEKINLEKKKLVNLIKKRLII